MVIIYALFRYYQALKVLEELEHTYLMHVDKYRFTQNLQKALAPVREQIKEKSFSEFTDFLENIRKVSGMFMFIYMVYVCLFVIYLFIYCLFTYLSI